MDPVARFLHRKPLRRIRRSLARGESVQAVTPGTHNGTEGALVLTNRRTFWVPRRGPFVIRERAAMHDDRKGSHSALVDANRPSWQVRNVPAGPARELARASKPPVAVKDDRMDRIRRLHAQGHISDEEYAWMRRDRS